jgi:Ca2+:H+ antiporter
MIDDTAGRTEKGKAAFSWKREWPLPLACGMLALILACKPLIAALMAHPAGLIGLLAAICAVLLVIAMSIVRHADVVAHRLGEPRGTLLLTLAVTGLEVAMVGFVMSTGDEKPTLARDTMLAVVMLVLNGFLGLSLLLGGLRHREQPFNLQSSNSFLVLIIPLAVLGLILPNHTQSTPGPTLSSFQMVFLSAMSVGIYAVFLLVQNRLHRGFFMMPEASAGEDDAHHVESASSTVFHCVMLGLYGLPLVLLAKQMTLPLDEVVERLGAPAALGGFLMACLVLTPESVSAIKAALQNRLQRSVNILLGSVLASIGLTVPMVICISLFTGRRLELGIQSTDTVMLALTLVTSVVTFSQPRTNFLLGCVHLLLFLAYLMLMFEN